MFPEKKPLELALQAKVKPSRVHHSCLDMAQHGTAIYCGSDVPCHDVPIPGAQKLPLFLSRIQGNRSSLEQKLREENLSANKHLPPRPLARTSPCRGASCGV